MSQPIISLLLCDEIETEELGRKLSTLLQAPSILFLQGELGAGKTTVVRGFLRARGFKGIVKSPTYTLVEEYTLEEAFIYHFDLYRLTQPEELQFMGIREYFRQDAIVLIEWPEQGGSYLPEPDLILTLTNHIKGRLAVLQPNSKRGGQILQQWEK